LCRWSRRKQYTYKDYFYYLETNACINGKFFCLNRFYHPKLISTSKLNDGICDCCDGSDEFNLSCPKTCLDLSTKEFHKLKEKLTKIKSVVNSFEKKNYEKFFDENYEFITNIISSYQKLKELRVKYKLIQNYLHKIEKSQISQNFDFEYIDSKGIKIRLLLEALEKIQNKISEEENMLKENQKQIDSFIKFNIFQEIQENFLRFEYGKYYCDLNHGKLKCNDINSWKNNKLLGQMSGMEDGVLIFSNGSICKNYNKNYITNIILECGEKEKIEFVEKKNNCEYTFVYYSKLGCNGISIRNILKKINMYIGDKI